MARIYKCKSTIFVCFDILILNSFIEIEITKSICWWTLWVVSIVRFSLQMIVWIDIGENNQIISDKIIDEKSDHINDSKLSSDSQNQSVEAEDIQWA